MPTGHLANALIWLSEWINVYTKPNTSIRALCCQIRLHPFIRQVQPLFNVQLYNITKWIKNKPSHHHNKVWLVCKSSLLIQSTVFSPALKNLYLLWYLHFPVKLSFCQHMRLPVSPFAHRKSKAKTTHYFTSLSYVIKRKISCILMLVFGFNT